MNISIKATNTTLSDSIRNMIEEKLSVLEKFSKPEHKFHVELEENSKEEPGKGSRVEISVQPSGYYAESSGADFYEALDLTIPKLKQQFVKAKEKNLSLRHRLTRRIKGLIFKD